MLPGRAPGWVAAVAQVRWAHAVQTLKAGAEPGKQQLHTGQQWRSLVPSVTHVFFHCLLQFQKGAGHCSLDIIPQSPLPALACGMQSWRWAVLQGYLPSLMEGTDDLASSNIFFLQKKLSHFYSVSYSDLGRGNKCWRGPWERPLLQRQCCPAPTLWTSLVGTRRSPGIYSASGSTPLPVEQINLRLSEGEMQNSWASINKTHHP